MAASYVFFQEDPRTSRNIFFKGTTRHQIPQLHFPLDTHAHDEAQPRAHLHSPPLSPLLHGRARIHNHLHGQFPL